MMWNIERRKMKIFYEKKIIFPFFIFLYLVGYDSYIVCYIHLVYKDSSFSETKLHPNLWKYYWGVLNSLYLIQNLLVI